MSLTVFNTPQAQASFMRMVKAKLLPRYQDMSDLPDAIKAVIARDAASASAGQPVKSFDDLVRDTVENINSSDPDSAPYELLAKAISDLKRDEREKIGDTLTVYFAQQVLEQVERLTPEEKQKILDQVKSEHPTYHATPIGQPISFNKPEELEALITAYYKGRLPTMLTQMLETDFPDALAYQIVAQGIPHDFIIQYEFDKCTTTYETSGLAKTLEAKYGPHILTKQYNALEYMEQNAHADGITLEKGVEYFQKQYGDTRETQLAMMLAEFKKTPYQTQHSGHELRFVNQAFIDLWDQWDADHTATTAHTYISIDDRSLLRLPVNILLFQDSLTQFRCEAKCLSYIPGWFGELAKLNQISIERRSAVLEGSWEYIHDFSDYTGFIRLSEICGHNIDLQYGLAQFRDLKKTMAAEGVNATDAETAFIANFGNTPFKQFVAFRDQHYFQSLPQSSELFRGMINQDYIALTRDPTFKPTQLRMIPRNFLPYAKTQTELDFSNQQLTCLPRWLYDQLPQLQRLDVSGNELTGHPINVVANRIRQDGCTVISHDNPWSR